LDKAAIAKVQLDLRRTVIRSPVNGYVTNLLARLGDYATVGQRLISECDRNFWRHLLWQRDRDLCRSGWTKHPACLWQWGLAGGVQHDPAVLNSGRVQQYSQQRQRERSNG
jgi:multidrug efflux pump subunit AcrA (membrane-fusion protein)